MDFQPISNVYSNGILSNKKFIETSSFLTGGPSEPQNGSIDAVWHHFCT